LEACWVQEVAFNKGEVWVVKPLFNVLLGSATEVVEDGDVDSVSFYFTTLFFLVVFYRNFGRLILSLLKKLQIMDQVE